MSASGANSFPGNAGYAGSAWFQTSGGSMYNAMAFLVRQIIAGKAFAALVKVISVSGGGPSGAPMVAVQPMVNQVDGFGNQTPHGTIYNIPAFRYRGGNCAFICDPVVGDIGEAVICDRDISAVKATLGIAGPGSARQNDWADGCYFGGFLSGEAINYVEVSASGINVNCPTLPLTFTAQNATLDSSGNLTVAGDVIANKGAAQISLMNHEHSAVTTGIEQSGPPVPGT